MPTRTSFLVLTMLITGCVANLRTASPSGTSTPSAPSRIAAADTAPVFFLDGVEIRAADAKLIDSTSISTIDYVSGPAAMSLYGPRARAGVIHIATKAAPRATTPTTPLFFLDGREIPAELARVLNSTRINRIDVLRGAAALAYSNRAHGGVVLIRSKAG
jgi:outer membrane receptor protein involved in Fe transport